MNKLYVVYTVDCFCEATIFGLYEDEEMAKKDAISFSNEMTDVHVKKISVVKQKCDCKGWGCFGCCETDEQIRLKRGDFI